MGIQARAVMRQFKALADSRQRLFGTDDFQHWFASLEASLLLKPG